MNDKISVAAPSPSWWVTGELAYTKDGGETVIRTGLAVDGQRVGYGVVGKENICFLAEYRTDDYCDTWTKMNGCTGVFTHDKKTGRLYGANDNALVYSDDDGITWNEIASLEHSITGMALDSKRGAMYLCTGWQVFCVDMNESQTNPVDCEFGFQRPHDMCIDPENPDIMYLVQNASQDMDRYGVWRTLDGGKTAPTAVTVCVSPSTKQPARLSQAAHAEAFGK